ncbi:cyclic pyranopterin monophosphate synthase MoaC [bacterium]|nr:cyclic pyranopterin monophosphate synthase MoaC [bacterium]
MGFNHFDQDGQAWMVDVSAKDRTLREARAEAVVQLGHDLLATVLDHGTAKGDVLGTARLAGIAAVKRTADLIPLAHPLALHHAAVAFAAESETGLLRCICTVKAVERTGVEMEAMTGATAAALTVYDMCKAVRRGIVIGPIRLLHKSGGRSGTYDAEGESHER